MAAGSSFLLTDSREIGDGTIVIAKGGCLQTEITVNVNINPAF
jgi:hypothetical protein